MIQTLFALPSVLAKTLLIKGSAAAIAPAVLAIAMSGGCASSSTEAQQTPALENVRVQVEPSDLIDISQPQVGRSGEDMTITGTVTRKPGDTGDVDGHLEVVILSADGETVLNQFPLSWLPKDIPTDGSRQSKYEVRYGYIPPPGSTVMIYFSDNAHVINRGGAGTAQLPQVSQSNTFSTKTPGRPAQPAQPRTPGTPRSGGGKR